MPTVLTSPLPALVVFFHLSLNSDSSFLPRPCFLLNTRTQDHGIDQRIDYKIMEQAKEALENKTPVSLNMPINNLDRTTGTILSYNISTK